ncbi:MAG: GDYXXLXY domain-containing protein [Deltaproteobacteria bacterium]|nr:GDYXXLXY domain-containing protein [Deltaproteobacteria bacterium]
MKPLVKGLVIAVIQVSLVASLGAKLLYDRVTQPRVWVNTAPYDPNLPIRGRYVSLRLIVEPRGMGEPKTEEKWHPSQAAVLRVEKERLVAEAKPEAVPHRASGVRMRYATVGDAKVAVLEEPVAFFIPEQVPDPSRRGQGEQLWVETTIPKKGPPRPIRLGVRQDDGPIVPLGLR